VREAFTEESSSCHVFVNVKFNGVLKFAVTVKFREFDTFSKCKSQGGGYHVSYGSPLKMSSKVGYYGAYTCEVKRHRVGL